MITREQVADLRPGDVVRISGWYDVTVEGPLTTSDVDEHSDALWLGQYTLIRDGVGNPAHWGCQPGATLTVVARAPRPLYINHDRTEMVLGDVFRGVEDDSPRIYVAQGAADQVWCTHHGVMNVGLVPPRLRLLVDGETGQVVPDKPVAAVDPLAHIRQKDTTPEAADADPYCSAGNVGLICTREPGHPGQHIAGCGAGNPVAAVWS